MIFSDGYLEVMGTSWYEEMYGVMCQKALDINKELIEAKAKIKQLEDHIQLLNKLKEVE